MDKDVGVEIVSMEVADGGGGEGGRGVEHATEGTSSSQLLLLFTPHERGVRARSSSSTVLSSDKEEADAFTTTRFGALSRVAATSAVEVAAGN